MISMEATIYEQVLFFGLMAFVGLLPVIFGWLAEKNKKNSGS